MRYVCLWGLWCLLTHPTQAQNLLSPRVDTTQNSANEYTTEAVLIHSTRANSKTGTTYENVSREQIKRRNFGQDLPMLLNQTTSAVVTSDAGAGIGYTGIRIRGVDGTATNVTINGVPLNDAESQGVFWVNMPDFATSVDNIQVQRGVGTSTNGSGAFGASINIQTKGYEAEPYVRLDNSIGSFRTLKNNLQVGTGLLNDHFVFDARLSRISSEGWVDRGRADLDGYFLSGAYYDEQQFFKVNVFSGHEVTYQSWFGIPEAKYRDDDEALQNHFVNNFFPGGLYQTPEDSANLFASGRSYNYYLYDNQVDDYRQTHYQALYGRELGENVNLNLVLHYTKGQGFFEEFREEDAFSAYGSAFGREEISVNGQPLTTTDLVRRRWLDNDYYGGIYTLDYRPTNQLALTLGGAWNQYDGNHFGEVIWARYAGQAEIREQYYFSRSLKTDLNSYIKGLWQPSDAWSAYLDLQVRTINYQLGGEDLAQAGVENEGQPIQGEFDYLFFNPKVGLTYQVNQQSNAYVSFAVANREPARRDLIANPEAVHAETLYDVETGYRIDLGGLRFNANGYLMYYQDQLVPTGQLNDVGAVLRENVAQSYRAGVEVELGLVLTDGLFLMGNATLSQNKILEYTDVVYDYLSNGEVEIEETILTQTDIAFSPNFISSLNLTYEPTQHVSLSAIGKYVGQQYLDNTQNEGRVLDPFFVLDARAMWTFQPAWAKEIQLGLLVNNVLSAIYAPNGYTYSFKLDDFLVTENFYYPQAPTNFLLRVGLSF